MFSITCRTKSDGTEFRKPWQVKYTDGLGKKRSKQFKLKPDAERWAIRVGADLQDGTHIAESQSATVARAGDLWLVTSINGSLQRSTVEQYRRHLTLHIKPFLGAIKLSQLGVPRIRAFTDALQADGRSPAMIRKILVSLSSLLSDAQERGLSARNPVREMRRARRSAPVRRRRLEVGIDIPSPAEIRALVHAAQGRWRPAIITATFSGLRSSELRALRWADIDLDARVLHVRQRVDRYGKIGLPKSEAGIRSIPLPPIAVNTLREWKLACPRNEGGYVFPNPSGNPQCHDNLIRMGLRPTWIAAGVVGRYTGLHSLRHFYASWCINRKVDGGLELPLKLVQSRLGHATLAMTADTYGLCVRSDGTVGE